MLLELKKRVFYLRLRRTIMELGMMVLHMALLLLSLAGVLRVAALALGYHQDGF